MCKKTLIEIRLVLIKTFRHVITGEAEKTKNRQIIPSEDSG